MVTDYSYKFIEDKPLSEELIAQIKKDWPEAEIDKYKVKMFSTAYGNLGVIGHADSFKKKWLDEYIREAIDERVASMRE